MARRELVTSSAATGVSRRGKSATHATPEAGEECDDGNAVSGDGCSSMCRLESGFECAHVSSGDRQACSNGTGDCLVLPITYRDFDGWNQTQGHPDFFFLGGSTICVPNAS